MTGFIPEWVTLKGRIRLSASVDAVFQMFSPLGEKLWVPGWEPEILYPASATWTEGLLFRTREDTGDAVWIVTKLDKSSLHFSPRLKAKRERARGDEARDAWRPQAYLNDMSRTASERNVVSAQLSRVAAKRW